MNVKVMTRCCALVFAIALGLFCRADPKKDAPQVAAPVIPETAVNLADYGGVGDGAMLNTGAFAKAIAALSEKGGRPLEYVDLVPQSQDLRLEGDAGSKADEEG